MKLDPYPKRKWYRLNRDKAIISPSPTAPYSNVAFHFPLSKQQTAVPAWSSPLHTEHIIMKSPNPKSEIRKPKTLKTQIRIQAVAHAPTTSSTCSEFRFKSELEFKVCANLCAACDSASSLSSAVTALSSLVPLLFTLNHLLFTPLWPRHANCLGQSDINIKLTVVEEGCRQE